MSIRVKGVSVIVCCFNSALKLPKTIEHLAFQVVPDRIPYEIVIVDNASTDNTAEAAYTLWRKYNRSDTSFIVVSEPKPGLSFAREKGISESHFEVLIFCDDDNWLANDYISTAYELMINDERIGALGGVGQAVNKMPIWLEDFKDFYALGPQAAGDGSVPSKCLYGAGIVLRKSAVLNLQKREFKSLLTGRIGSKLISGEDIELTMALSIIGYEIYYSSRLRFFHDISTSRYELRYFLKLTFYIGYSWMALTPYHIYLSNSKGKYPHPNLGDVYYILKSLGANLIKLLLALLFKKKLMFEKLNLTLFKSGQLWFSISKFKFYSSQPSFLKD